MNLYFTFISQLFGCSIIARYVLVNTVMGSAKSGRRGGGEDGKILLVITERK